MKKRGYFGIGVEGISKPMNFGNLSRTAYGFGASFVFSVSPGKRMTMPPSDTPMSQEHVPLYTYSSAAEMVLPEGCRLVAVEFDAHAIDLPRQRTH